MKEFGEWEDEVLSLLSSYIRPGDVVFEGGSHIGTHTIPLSLMVGKSGFVHAFEPHWKNRGVLYNNVVFNDAGDSVEIHDVVLGNSTSEGSSGYERMSIGDGKNDNFDVGDVKEENSGVFCFKDQKQVEGHVEGRTVRSTSIDTLVRIRELPTTCPSVIKTDLEGMDVWAIQGSLELIVRCKPVIYIEAHAPLRKAMRDLISFFNENGVSYKCFYDSFRTVPVVGTTYYTSEEGDIKYRKGAISFNFLCAPADSGGNFVNAFVEEATLEWIRNGRLLPTSGDVDEDSIYCWGDHEEVEELLLSEGYYDIVVGKNEKYPGLTSLCRR